MMGSSLLRILTVAAVIAFSSANPAGASQALKLQKAPINASDVASLQNGAKLFVNYCLNCHSASYMRYNRLHDLGLTEQQIRDNLVFTGVKVGELMNVAMDKKDAKDWFGAPPPDLTVIARSRSSSAGSGADWLYAYLRSFYRDPTRASGWNNLIFPNVGMPHVLWELNGAQQLVVQEFRSEDEARGSLIMSKSVARIDVEATVKDGAQSVSYKLKTLQPGKGALSQIEYDKQVADLVNFMNYMAEPARLTRREIGVYVLLFLSILIALAYALKKSYWKDVH